MKKSTKIILTVGISLLIIGFLMSLVAFLMGITPFYIWKSVRDRNTVVYPSGENNFIWSSTEQNIRNLHIELGQTELHIIPGDSFVFTADGKIDSIAVTGDTLHIKHTEKDSETFGLFKSYLFEKEIPPLKATLTVPYNVFFENITLEIGMGEFESKMPLKCKRSTLNVGLGSCSLEDFSVTDYFETECDIGSLTIQGTIDGTSKIQCGMGSLFIQGNLKGNSKIQCGMGTVELITQGNPDDYNYKTKVGMGSVQIGDKTFEGLSNKERFSSAAKNYFDIDCGMGAITISFVDTFQEHTL